MVVVVIRTHPHPILALVSVIMICARPRPVWSLDNAGDVMVSAVIVADGGAEGVGHVVISAGQEGWCVGGWVCVVSVRTSADGHEWTWVSVQRRRVYGQTGMRECGQVCMAGVHARGRV